MQTNATSSIGDTTHKLWQDFNNFTKSLAEQLCQNKDGVVNERPVPFVSTVIKIGIVASLAFVFYQIWKNPILSLVCFISGGLVRLQPETVKEISTTGYDFLTKSFKSINDNETILEKAALLVTGIVLFVYGLASLMPPVAASTYVGYKLSQIYLPKVAEKYVTGENS